MKTVNITPAASAEGLRRRLEVEAQKRGLNVRQMVGDVYAYSTSNKRQYAAPLHEPREPKGDHIGAVVRDDVVRKLDEWARQKKTTRGDLCRYILEKTLEDQILGKVLGEQE
jgi:hypothetical protein